MRMVLCVVHHLSVCSITFVAKWYTAGFLIASRFQMASTANEIRSTRRTNLCQDVCCISQH